MHFSLITVRSPVGKHNQVAPPGEKTWTSEKVYDESLYEMALSYDA